MTKDGTADSKAKPKLKRSEITNIMTPPPVSDVRSIRMSSNTNNKLTSDNKLCFSHDDMFFEESTSSNDEF